MELEPDYPDLGFGSPNEDKRGAESINKDTAGSINDTRLTKPIVLIGSKTAIGRSPCFEALPAVVHFCGFKVSELYEHEVSIINRSGKSQRLQISAPTTGEFASVVEKIGSIAPGMRQMIKIKFHPQDYKYYYDCIRVRGEDQNLLIPLHGYPVPNKVYFPPSFDFGKIPICNIAKQDLELSCSIPVNFSFSIEVLEPHAQFSVEPVGGIIPANGSVTISIAFHPITLGLCTTRIRVTVHQHDSTPIECNITAQAVSGLIESHELQRIEQKVINRIMNTGSFLSGVLGPKSTLRGDIADPLRTNSDYPNGEASTLQDMQKTAKPNTKDPVSVLLTSTFGAEKLSTALGSVVSGTDLLGTKVSRDRTGAFEPGVRALFGTLQVTLPVKPKGPGSGAVFDAGAQWMTTMHRRRLIQSKGKSVVAAGLVPSPQREKIVNGLTIPPKLDSVASVTYVLTQEPGKLKPKDLKEAIDRNRAEREQRAEDQRRLREEGGGAGAMDLRGILAEEQLNMADGNAFKRQLRELAFLADVEEVEKLEIEKSFRVSEEYVGANILAPEEITVVNRHRAKAALLKKRTLWRSIQERQHSEFLPPKHATVKAGAPAEVADHLASTLSPSFDANSNDIWAKRMNTLRRLVSRVSRWIVRRRVGDRLARLKSALQTAGVTNKEQARAWINLENATSVSRVGGSSEGSKWESSATTATASGIVSEVPETAVTAATKYSSVAMLVCATDDETVFRRRNSTFVVNNLRFEPDRDMIKRILFPKCIVEEGSVRMQIPIVPIETLTQFDDRTLFPLKIRPEHITMRYSPHRVPIVPLDFPSGEEKILRQGAAEEAILYPAADESVTFADVFALRPSEPPNLVTLRENAMKGSLDAVAAIATNEITPSGTGNNMSEGFPEQDLIEEKLSAPAWLSREPEWHSSALNYFTFRPDYRKYPTATIARETDSDWILRPYSEHLAYEDDSSLRSSLLRRPGFLSANTYILGGHENRCTDPPPPPGPTLTDFFQPDIDRHRSGLYCFARDHLRTLTGPDPDIGPFQRGQDAADVLTDSESDDEEKYVVPAPTIAKIRDMLRKIDEKPAETVSPTRERPMRRTKSAKPTKEDTLRSTAIASPPLSSTAKSIDASEAFPLQDSRNIQVELLRDRKILDLESALTKATQAQASKVAARLVDISRASRCLIQALPVQKPLHEYEDSLRTVVEDEMEGVPINFSEISAHKYIETSTSTSLLSPLPTLASPLM